jgi:hypothetical protein
MQRSGHMEAISHVTRGLELIKTLPHPPERPKQELDLQTTLGLALMAAKGMGAPEVGIAYGRARELCHQVGDTPQLFQVLLGLSRFYRQRSDVGLIDWGPAAAVRTSIVRTSWGALAGPVKTPSKGRPFPSAVSIDTAIRVTWLAARSSRPGNSSPKLTSSRTSPWAPRQLVRSAYRSADVLTATCAPEDARGEGCLRVACPRG